ncbi:hypothetical protein FLK61_39100 [Paenalkalicoccus suaedae]|uniref:Uncharacterized protein n=1 Tax=Paenalkalicoccus suaedae TaxID=2592382 RepID=A0A859FIN3_9BACI|nr:hypothetical protein FLK61_39100 [Paenalkalicoccus suaedae]
MKRKHSVMTRKMPEVRSKVEEVMRKQKSEATNFRLVLQTKKRKCYLLTAGDPKRRLRTTSGSPSAQRKSFLAAIGLAARNS